MDSACIRHRQPPAETIQWSCALKMTMRHNHERKLDEILETLDHSIFILGKGWSGGWEMVRRAAMRVLCYRLLETS